MNHKNLMNFIIIRKFILIHLVLIVLCHSKCRDEKEVNSSFYGKNSSTLVLSRERRHITRGQNNYFQRSYDKNRLQFENYNRFLEPRRKPYFHRVNEVFSYYLPPKPDLIDSHKHFEDKNIKYGTKSKPKSVPRKGLTFNKLLLPTSSYQSWKKHNSLGLSSDPSRVQQSYRPHSHQYFEMDKREQDYQNYRPQLHFGSDGPEKDYQIDRLERDFQTNRREEDYQNYRRKHDFREENYESDKRDRRESSYSSYSSSSSSSTSSLIPESQTIARNSTYIGIPGWIRRDFPGYNEIPYTGFRCDLQPYYGYYADTNAGCQVFHVCQTDGRHYSFLCPNGTLFHQKVQTCDWWYHVDCPSSTNFYHLNSRIGVLPPLPATLSRFD